MCRSNGIISINVLSAGQAQLADHFAGRTHIVGDTKFFHGSWRTGLGGQPILEGAVSNIIGTLSESYEAGSHTIFIFHVRDLEMGESSGPLLYHRRGYSMLQRSAWLEDTDSA